MARYTKLYSNYILKKRHQEANGGTIFERDWGTLGERHVIERGKKRIYSDSNFLFTDNTITGNKYRSNTGSWSDGYTMNSLGGNIDNSVNDTSVISETNDIRDYAYYGSAVELVRVSIENIIKWFPGRFLSEDRCIERSYDNGATWKYIKTIISDGHNNYAIEYVDTYNKFNVGDTIPSNVGYYVKDYAKYGIGRIIPANTSYYELQNDRIDTEHPQTATTDYVVQPGENYYYQNTGDYAFVDNQTQVTVGSGDDFYYSGIGSCEIFTVGNPFTIDFTTTNPVFGENDNKMRNMPFSFKNYVINVDNDKITVNGTDILTWNVWAKPYSECDNNYTIKYDVTFTFKDGNDDTVEGHLYGIVIDRSVVWCTDIRNLIVQPKPIIIDNYFSSLKGFEAKLLDRSRNPIYTTKLITPIPYNNNNPNYLYIERSYTWPHDGYCIYVDTIGFEGYVNSLYGLADKMDNMWCDNLWRNMTHEAIQNFDWTYTKNYEEGQEEENVLGGTRMEGILRIWGRCYDDIKRYVDGISLKNCITYDIGAPCLGNAELSDKAELLGWEIYSTKQNNNDNIYLDSQFVDNYVGKWYDTMNPDSVSQNDVDNDFMKRLVLSSGEIFRTKGTKHSMEMVFGMFGIGNSNPPKVYTVTSETPITNPISMDDTITHTAYNQVSDNVFEFHLPIDEYTCIIVPQTCTVKLKYVSSGNEVECGFPGCLSNTTGPSVTNMPNGYVLFYYGNGGVDTENARIEITVPTQSNFQFIEKYYSVEPRKRDDIFRYLRLNPLGDSSVYTESFPFPINTFEEYLDALRANPRLLDSLQTTFKTTIDGNCYDLITNTTVGEFCEQMINFKSPGLEYEDDEFSGTPIRDVFLENEHYIVPYFTQKQIYDGNVYFESKGGWGKSVDEGYVFDTIKKQEFDYLETIPYLEIVESVGSLLEVNTYQIGDKRIFYALDLSDFSVLGETIPTNLSHFFKLMDYAHPNQTANWKNIPLDGLIMPSYNIFNGITQDDVKTAQYCDQLSFDNLGNNPHCGYGSYDMGTEYLDYLETPFKYPVDYYAFTNPDNKDSAAQFMFNIREINADKIGNHIQNYLYVKYEENEVIDSTNSYFFASGPDTYVKAIMPEEFPYTVKTGDVYCRPDGTLYTPGETIASTNTYCVNNGSNLIQSIASFPYTVQSTDEYYRTNYILPSKVFVLKNNIKSSNYKKYFYDIILKYVLQVIPSTTILMIENKKDDAYESYYFTDNLEVTTASPISFNIVREYVGDEFNPSEMKETTLIIIKIGLTVTLEYEYNGVSQTVTEPRLEDVTPQNLINGLPTGYRVLYWRSNGADDNTIKITVEQTNV